MKSCHPFLWAVGCVALAAPLAQAQYPYPYQAYSPVFKQPLLSNPDGCGPGYYYYDCYGTLYGPTYYIRPPWEPFNGILPGPKNGPPVQAPIPVVGPNGKPY